MKLSDAIAPSFYSLHNKIKRNEYIHYWLKGGRGSTKSSFASIEIILGIMNDSTANAVCLRKVKETLKDSVYEQLKWAIEILGVEQYFDLGVSPLHITYLPTNQKILFRGTDNPKKIKSIKFKKGYCKFIWFEEVDEFNGMEEIRLINQTLMRGGESFVIFYTYNPPKSVNNWVNTEVTLTKDNRYIHHSTYLDVPKKWLGEQFFVEAEHLKKVNPTAYNHEYLGEVTGTGGEVFNNVTIRPITDAEISIFDNLRRGIDFGYAVDPFAYGVMHYDKTRKRLYIFHEFYKVGLSNRQAIEYIKKENTSNKLITADSAEPKSIDEFRSNGIKITGAKKGPDSIDYGIKFLQDLEEIIIDDNRCPNTAREFLTYEIEKDAQGNLKSKYPDKNNHTIDMTRYALESDMKQNNKLKPLTRL